MSKITLTSDIVNDMTCDLISNNYEIILDRKSAIEKGVSLLEKNDILLILGKGHENYQVITGISYHFNDKEEVLKCINKQLYYFSRLRTFINRSTTEMTVFE